MILPDANITDAVDKIAWGKFINAGQTCIAPDYVYVHESKRSEFLGAIKARLQQSPKPQDMARIIDRPAFNRFKALMSESQAKKEPVICGGEFDEKDLYISPTAIEVQTDSPWMREEIFGPILPVLFYQDLDSALAYIRSKSKPLALYIFGSEGREKILRQTTAGGSVVNHVALHFANHSLPFGGVGASGQGNYHGYAGFRAFSHERAVMIQSPLGISKFLFPPYDRSMVKMGLWFLKLFSR